MRHYVEQQSKGWYNHTRTAALHVREPLYKGTIRNLCNATFASGTEEGVVQLWTEIICEENGIGHNRSYVKYTSVLRGIKGVLWPDMPEKEYSSMLFEMPLEDRFDFLQDNMAKYMLKRGDATAQDFLGVRNNIWINCGGILMELQELLDAIREDNKIIEEKRAKMSQKGREIYDRNCDIKHGESLEDWIKLSDDIIEFLHSDECTEYDYEVITGFTEGVAMMRSAAEEIIAEREKK